MPEAFDVGQIIAGKYELVRLLGRGASSAVWAAKHAALGETFALKVLDPPADVAAEEASARFHEQAQLSATLSKKTRHVVSVTDYGEERGWPYVVMELLEGETLETRLERGPIEPAETADIVGQIARALAVAHGMNLFHGNLVPANIFLAKDEEGRALVKLLDFGFYHAPKAPEPEVVGDPDDEDREGGVQRFAATTSPYASPEQIRGEPGVDFRADLWALTVIAYRCFTGVLPWAGDTIEEIVVAICTHQWTPSRDQRPTLPYVVEALFARGFSLEVDDRFKSSKELAATLRAGFPHTGRAEGGRAAFASRPNFDEELGAAPKPSAPVAIASPPPPPPARSPLPEAPAEPPKVPSAAPQKARSEAPIAVTLPSPAPTPATSGARARWVGLAVALAVAVVTGLALWATHQ